MSQLKNPLPQPKNLANKPKNPENEPKNPENKPVISSLKQLQIKETDPNKKPSINACLKKVIHMTETIKRKQVVWCANGKDAFITELKEKNFKVHQDPKADFSKVFSLYPGLIHAKMASTGGNSSTITPQPNKALPIRSVLGSVISRVANPASSTTPAPGAATRTQPPGAASRAAKQIPNPTEDEKKAVALYNVRDGNELYGTHIIWAKIRPDSNYRRGQKEVDLDIHYDTGSMVQGVPSDKIKEMIGDNPPQWDKAFMLTADGTRHQVESGLFQLKIFKDKERKEVLEDWFDAVGNLGDQTGLSGGEMRVDSGLIFANMSRNKPLIVGKSKLGVIWHMATIP